MNRVSNDNLNAEKAQGFILYVPSSILPNSSTADA